MPYRGDVFARGSYYHCYNRGVGRGRLFFGPDNYEHCLRLLKVGAPRYGAVLVAYCLMPNHYHLLLRQEGDLPLSRFLGGVFNAYVQAVNRQSGRSGTLFEGRFRHVCVDREEYLCHLCRYIHLNPVKAGLVTRAEEWPHTDYRVWIGLRRGTPREEAFIRQLWSTPEEYRRFVEEHVDDRLIEGYMLD